MKTLRSHQQEGFDKFKNEDSCPLFLEMRLGKTLLYIRWVKSKDPPPLVSMVITRELTYIDAWKTELEEEGEKYFIFAELSKAKRLEMMTEVLETISGGKRAWLLLNYQTYMADYKLFNMLPWEEGAVALDESRFVHNPKSNVSKMLCGGRVVFNEGKPNEKTVSGGKLAQDTRFKGILTGTPAPESYLDFFQQLKFVYGKFMGTSNFYEFRHNYFEQDWRGEWVPKKGTKATLNHILRHLCFVKTRRDAGVPFFKSYQTRSVRMTEEQKALYQEILEEWQWTDPLTGETHYTDLAPTRLLWLQRVCGGFTPEPTLLNPIEKNLKMQMILSELEENLKGEKVVLWCKFRAEAMLLLQGCLQFSHSGRKETINSDPNNNIYSNCCIINGDVNLENRIQAIRGFRENSDIRYFISTIKAGRSGINLSRGKASIYYSNEASGEDRLQSEDRILDTQEEEPLLYLDAISRWKTNEQSADEDIYEMVVTKKMTNKMFMQKWSKAERGLK